MLQSSARCQSQVASGAIITHGWPRQLQAREQNSAQGHDAHPQQRCFHPPNKEARNEPWFNTRWQSDPSKQWARGSQRAGFCTEALIPQEIYPERSLPCKHQAEMPEHRRKWWFTARVSSIPAKTLPALTQRPFCFIRDVHRHSSTSELKSSRDHRRHFCGNTFLVLPAHTGITGRNSTQGLTRLLTQPELTGDSTIAYRLSGRNKGKGQLPSQMHHLSTWALFYFILKLIVSDTGWLE